jgi:GNAT superfamily N-acetyltransferase
MDASIRDQGRLREGLEPGDLGYATYLHGRVYAEEYGFGPRFEAYVARGLCELADRRGSGRDRAWVCEHRGRMVGFIASLDREEAAQLRYFIVDPEYRGLGLGSLLMGRFLSFVREKAYRRAYLWTTDELATARRMYESAGFKLVEEKPSTDFGKPLTELRYELSLGSGRAAS